MSNPLHTLLEQSWAASLAVTMRDAPAISLVTYSFQLDPLRLFLFVSELSAHTSALREHPRCALLIHALPSASDPNSNHALTRVMMDTTATFLSREQAQADGVVSQWRHKYAITDTLLGLSDFHFVELRPLRATFVQGFGKAYECSGANLENMEHVRPR
jgi:putative heme iron utilization protein